MLKNIFTLKLFLQHTYIFIKTNSTLIVRRVTQYITNMPQYTIICCFHEEHNFFLFLFKKNIFHQDISDQ